MLVSDVMTRDLLTAAGHLTVADGLTLALERDVHHLLVVEHGKLTGVTCICDLRRRPVHVALRECIVRAPVVIWAECTLEQAAQRFIEKEASCFPVCDEGQLVGVLTRGDLQRGAIDETELPARFHCVFCGGTRHVRPLRGDPFTMACLDCSERTAPAISGLFEEGGQD